MQTTLEKYTNRVKIPDRPVLNREKEIDTLNAVFYRPEISNAILLGEAGSGKTMIVQGLAAKDRTRIYLSVDLSRMIDDLKDDVSKRLPGALKTLFDEVEEYQKEQKKELVLFVDEFHQIAQLSPPAVEALKPLLADSGTRGIRLIAATTYEEFRQWIAPNQPLVERLERINVSQTDRDTTIAILKSIATQNGMTSSIQKYGSESLYGLIFDYTNRFIPSDSQPRKSIRILDSMIGWCRYKPELYHMNRSLLGTVIENSTGIHVTFKVDALNIKKTLDKAVLSQDYATTKLEEQLQVAAANLQRKDRPMASFLFTGSTGVGKTECTKQLAKILFDDPRSLIRFDMTEYALDDSIGRFKTELTARIWERPHSILLLDEIEKAAPTVTHLLLQVLDDGRLVNDNGREISFLNTYIIMTTNAGSEIYQNRASYNVDDEGRISDLYSFEQALQDSLMTTTGAVKFPPELLGRIDVIVPFAPLSDRTRERITVLMFRKLFDEVKKEHHIQIIPTPRLIRYITRDLTSLDPSTGGARNIDRAINSKVKPVISRYLNEMESKNRSLQPYLLIKVEGILASEDPGVRLSDARVVLEPSMIKPEIPNSQK